MQIGFGRLEVQLRGLKVGRRSCRRARSAPFCALNVEPADETSQRDSWGRFSGRSKGAEARGKTPC
eukprot:12922079-Prorocentrum_lima.AAC.1